MSVPMPETLPCPFCGADASAGWVMDAKDGKSLRVACSREGECPSPEWQEPASEYEGDGECVASVIRFWNQRSGDWSHGWTQPSGKKPAGPVLVNITERASERIAAAIGYDPYRYAIARWQKGQWRDVVNGRIYRVRAWRHIAPPPDRWA